MQEGMGKALVKLLRPTAALMATQTWDTILCRHCDLWQRNKNGEQAAPGGDPDAFPLAPHHHPTPDNPANTTTYLFHTNAYVGQPLARRDGFDHNGHEGVVGPAPACMHGQDACVNAWATHRHASGHVSGHIPQPVISLRPTWFKALGVVGASVHNGS